MGQIVDILRNLAEHNGDTVAAYELNKCVAVRVAEKEVAPQITTRNVEVDPAAVVQAKLSIRKLSRVILPKKVETLIAERYITEGWDRKRLAREVSKAAKTAEERLHKIAQLERERELADIERLHPKGDGGRLDRTHTATTTQVGWTLDDVRNYLMDPTKLVYVASRLGWSKERCGKVSTYLQWRLGSQYPFGCVAMNSTELKLVEEAARHVLKIRK